MVARLKIAYILVSQLVVRLSQILHDFQRRSVVFAVTFIVMLRLVGSVILILVLSEIDLA